MVNNLKILHSSGSKVLIFFALPMPHHHIGQRIQVLDTVDSSNNYAMGLARSGAAIHGDAFFALEQTSGKGQQGKQWLSQKGKNIALSIVLETTLLQPKDLFLLSMAMALGSCDYLRSVAGADCRIKWPNDLYWRDRKAGGILIENSWQATRWQFAIVGIGLNINQLVFDETLKKAVSLQQITGMPIDLMDGVRQICVALELRWQQLLKGGGANLLQEYNSVLYGRDQMMQLRHGADEFAATIVGVNADGELLTLGVEEKTFKVGEVIWV
jgi:BirA family transcriptional regulator, biotin operon repressor / biotin---[acetyl-CoA-carboxylase] ligase